MESAAVRETQNPGALPRTPLKGPSPLRIPFIQSALKKIKKHLLLFSMALITLLAGANIFIVLYAFRSHEAALDSMIRSYVLDLADNVSESFQNTGRRMMGHGGMMMHFRMLSMSPLPDGDAGGVLILTGDGKILTASPGAEKLLPVWRDGVPIGEPRMVRDAGGDQFCIAARKMENGWYVLAAVSRTYLLGPALEVRRLWMSSAVLASFAVFAGMLGLWRYLVAPLHRVVEGIRNMKWGHGRPQMPCCPAFREIGALSNAIAELAGEAVAREELRVRYVSDIVRIEEDSRKRLARDLHDSPLQGVVAAIKRIQLARASLKDFSEASFRAAAENLEAAEEITQSAAAEMRNTCDELSPSWVKLGLSAAMFENADRLSRAFGVEVDVSGAEETEFSLQSLQSLQALPAIPEEHILAFVRILQEAVSNSARHGEASRVTVDLRREGEGGNESLRFRVQDNGRGFSAAVRTGIDYERLRDAGHRGLAHIHERVQLLEGTMRLESEPGGGCLIDISVPCPTRPRPESHE